MPNWKTILLKAAGWGAGFAMVLCLSLGGWLRYATRPKPPQPWNNESIKAEFYRLDTTGEDNHFQFLYLLQNTTNLDYKLDNGDSVRIAAVLQDNGGLAGFESNTLKLAYPIFVPAGQKTRILLDLEGHPFKERLKNNASVEERGAYRNKLAAHLRDERSNLNGFRVFDESHRYEIILPPGWKEKAPLGSKENPIIVTGEDMRKAEEADRKREEGLRKPIK